nr:3-methyl-2-oxobutanoate hydroxymethyltransferase [uncultured Capnocytophaga sp.]
MSVSKKETKRVTVQTLQAMKAKGEKITMLTAYDYTMAKIIDGAGIDIILVGDSAANVMAGYETTLPMTLEAMIYHASAVVRACSRALVVADLPFGTYQSDPQRALDSAIKMMKESGAQAVKLEGGREIGEGIRRILDAGIPVIGHLGLTPQSINKFGGYGLRAKEDAEAQNLWDDAIYLQELGCSAIVLEKIPSAVAKGVTQSLSIPTIGIGAGSDVDGQVLVSQDFFGMFVDYKPKFVRQYLNLHEQMTKAVTEYINDVKSVSFPNENEQY